jgi:hypothetical protein
MEEAANIARSEGGGVDLKMSDGLLGVIENAG